MSSPRQESKAQELSKAQEKSKQIRDDKATRQTCFALSRFVITRNWAPFSATNSYFSPLHAGRNTRPCKNPHGGVQNVAETTNGQIRDRWRTGPAKLSTGRARQTEKTKMKIWDLGVGQNSKVNWHGACKTHQIAYKWPSPSSFQFAHFSPHLHHVTLHVSYMFSLLVRLAW